MASALNPTRLRKTQSYGLMPAAIDDCVEWQPVQTIDPLVSLVHAPKRHFRDKLHRDCENVTTKRPKTLWDAIKQALETAPVPLSEQDLVHHVAASDYPGSPTRVRIRSVIRRQILFDHVAETEPGTYQLTNR